MEPGSSGGEGRIFCVRKDIHKKRMLHARGKQRGDEKSLQGPYRIVAMESSMSQGYSRCRSETKRCQ